MKEPFRSIAIAAITVGGLTAIPFAYSLLTATRADLNPAIFPAFRHIERACLREEWPHETVRCQIALRQMEQCERADCPADDYWNVLQRAGFDLPPLTVERTAQR